MITNPQMHLSLFSVSVDVVVVVQISEWLLSTKVFNPRLIREERVELKDSEAHLAN